MLPTKPLNTDYLHEYSRELALKLSNKFFTNTEIITGDQILEFSTIKQINFLVLKILEERWEAEASRLESPFFDYSQPEVQDGLRTFLNVLSRHIKVQRKAFTAILIEAIYGTLQLVLDPRSFYEKEIQKPAKIKVTAEYYRRSIKYIQYNREIFKTFVGELALRHTDSFQIEDALAVWHNTLRDHWRYIEPIEWRIKAFGNLLDLDLDAVYTRAVEVEEISLQDEKEDFEPKNEEKLTEDEEQAIDFFLPEIEIKEEILPTFEEKVTDFALPEVETKEEILPTFEEKVTDFALPEVETKEEILPTFEEKVTDFALPEVETKEEILPIWEEKEEILPEIEALPTLPGIETKEDTAFMPFTDSLPNLNKTEEAAEKHISTSKNVDDNTIAGKYRQERVNSLLEAIPLHEKFTFIDELFGGDNLAFQDALEKIDKSPNYEEARRLTNQYLLQHNWDFDRDSTQDFLAWLSRRF